MSNLDAMNDFQLDIIGFLKCTNDSFSSLEELDYFQVKQLVDFYHQIPIENIIETLKMMQIRDSFLSYEIPVFGTFEIGVNRVPELLEFSPEGLTFKKLGSLLLQSENETNSQKYGEVSAKTAALMSLAYIEESHPKLVKRSNFGHCLVGFSMPEKEPLLKAVLLRNEFIQSLVYHAVYTPEWKYSNWVPALSETSKMRRRQNVRKLLVFITAGSQYESCVNNIDWSL